MFERSLAIRRIRMLCSIAFFCGIAQWSSDARGAGIRDFDVRTKEKLGRQLYERMQRRATLSESQQRAKRAAVDALPRLDKRRYQFAVLDDPDGSGHLVYAIATSTNPDEIVAGVHYRVTVSVGGRVERTDALTRSALVLRKNGPDMPADYHHVAFIATNTVTATPVETYSYLSLVHGEPILVVTPDAAVWVVQNGTMKKDTKKR
jgi:hypothetical protein